MKPLDAPRSGKIDGEADKAAADALPLKARPDGRVEQEGVCSTIPRDVDKPNQQAIGHGTDVAKVLR
jgi:hypothetical protein